MKLNVFKHHLLDSGCLIEFLPDTIMTINHYFVIDMPFYHLLESFSHIISFYSQIGIIGSSIQQDTKYLKFYLKRAMAEASEPKVFSFDDLSFGFVIHLICLGISGISFFIEFSQWPRIIDFWRKKYEKIAERGKSAQRITPWAIEMQTTILDGD